MSQSTQRFELSLTRQEVLERRQYDSALLRYEVLLLKERCAALQTTIAGSQRLLANFQHPGARGVVRPPPASPLSPAAPNHLPNLTPRELLVLKMIAEGLATKEIACQLRISFKTAACHRFNLMKKLNLRDTVSVVRFAIRQGLVQP